MMDLVGCECSKVEARNRDLSHDVVSRDYKFLGREYKGILATILFIPTNVL
jgi:hypothetical protein